MTPDYETIRRAAAEVDRLAKAGELTRERFREQLDRATRACAGDGDLLTPFLRYAKPGWVDVKTE